MLLSCLGMDYKELIHGSQPLEAVKAVLMESNVHLLAKLVPKISSTDEKQIVTSEEIFAAFLSKMFWQGDKKQDGEVWCFYLQFMVLC